MTPYLGIIFALIALLGWAFGDFFMQQTTRVVGVWKSLFFIGLVGLVVLLPFAWGEMFTLTLSSWVLLFVLGFVVVFASVFFLQALQEGKIAIIEPLNGMELPLTIGLSIVLGHEHLTLMQLGLIAMVFIGLILAMTTRFKHLHYHRRILEKGVILAGVGAIGMALTNFLVGVSSQQISPLMTIWFAHSLLAVVCAFYLLYKRQFKNLWADVKMHPKIIISQSILDNVAWVAFAFATVLIPISIATTISESYIALAVLLGIFINREKIRSHQVIGIMLAIGGVVLLSIYTTN